jgi:hypothetical protein
MDVSGPSLVALRIHGALRDSAIDRFEGAAS